MILPDPVLPVQYAQAMSVTHAIATSGNGSAYKSVIFLNAPPLPIQRKGRSHVEGLAFSLDWNSAVDLNLRVSRFKPRRPDA